MTCPFCKGEMKIVMEPMGILHSYPPCQKYIAEDPLVFLRNARLATVGPLPDDPEWPLPVEQTKTS